MNRPVNFEKGTTSNAKAPAVTKISQSNPVSQPKSQPRQKTDQSTKNNHDSSKSTDRVVHVVSDKTGRAKQDKPKWLAKESIENALILLNQLFNGDVLSEDLQLTVTDQLTYVTQPVG